MKIAVLLAAAGAACLAGCGQKGALYLPEKNAAQVTAPAAPPAPAAAAAPAAPAAPASTATPSVPPAQTAPPPAPQKKQNADDDSQK